jgi:hypothetical protein
MRVPQTHTITQNPAEGAGALHILNHRPGDSAIRFHLLFFCTGTIRVYTEPDPTPPHIPLPPDAHKSVRLLPRAARERAARCVCVSVQASALPGFYDLGLWTWPSESPVVGGCVRTAEGFG